MVLELFAASRFTTTTWIALVGLVDAVQVVWTFRIHHGQFDYWHRIWKERLEQLRILVTLLAQAEASERVHASSVHGGDKILLVHVCVASIKSSAALTVTALTRMTVSCERVQLNWCGWSIYIS